MHKVALRFQLNVAVCSNEKGYLWPSTMTASATCPDGELIKHRLLPTPPCTWCRRTGGQPKTWATTIKAGPKPTSRSPSFEKGLGEWLISSHFSQERRNKGPFVGDVAYSIGDDGPNRLGQMPIRVQASSNKITFTGLVGIVHPVET